MRYGCLEISFYLRQRRYSCATRVGAPAVLYPGETRHWRVTGTQQYGNDLPKLTNFTSMSRVAKQSGQLLLNHRQQPHLPRGDDREQITSAQAAEALFTPKRQPIEPSASESVALAEQPARKPRVLPILCQGLLCTGPPRHPRQEDTTPA
jgi:hypothetical protein